MIIRVDKCSTFDIKKSLTKSIQYLPNLIINNSRMPPTELGNSFCYLGRYSEFEMTNSEHKLELVTLITNLMKEKYLKPLHPKNKILIYTRYVLSKLSWHFTITTLPKTWISENFDSIVNQYIRKWLEVPISGTLSNVYLTTNKFGLNVITPSNKLVQCQTTIRTALKLSPNKSITHLWNATNNHTNIQYDQYNSTKEAIKAFQNKNKKNKLKNRLTCQGSFSTIISKFSLAKVNAIWPSCQSKLPKRHFQLHHSLYKYFPADP